jgi:hypothetical protein
MMENFYNCNSTTNGEKLHQETAAHLATKLKKRLPTFFPLPLHQAPLGNGEKLDWHTFHSHP